MGFNYVYKLKDNPKLTSLNNISFDPVTEEHKDIVDRAVKRYREGRIKGVVADRETHEHYVDNVYGNPELTATDHVTVRFPELDKEVSLVCDAHTQMHCIPGKTVYVLRTSRGTIIAFDD